MCQRDAEPPRAYYYYYYYDVLDALIGGLIGVGPVLTPLYNNFLQLKLLKKESKKENTCYEWSGLN